MYRMYNHLEYILSFRVTTSLYLFYTTSNQPLSVFLSLSLRSALLYRFLVAVA